MKKLTARTNSKNTLQKSWKKLFFCLVTMASLPVTVLADSTNVPVIATTPQTNVATLFYVTFRTTNTSYAGRGQCPTGLTLLPGSATSVPAIPGFASAIYYWQCQQSINGWSGGPLATNSLQPYQNMQYPGYAAQAGLGTTCDLTNPNNTSNWYEYPPSGSPCSSSSTVCYSYCQFAGNQFIPTGVGGSGINCPSSVGNLTMTCVNGSSQSVYSQTAKAITTTPIVFGLSPADTATCTITSRQYSWGNCGPITFTVPAGQAAVLACCPGSSKVVPGTKWVYQTGAWSNPQLTTCGSCPT